MSAYRCTQGSGNIHFHTDCIVVLQNCFRTHIDHFQGHRLAKRSHAVRTRMLICIKIIFSLIENVH